MLTRNWPRHLLCLSLSLPLGSALACGPDFPMRLLDNRGQTMAELPEGNFNFELSRLGKTIAGLKSVTAATYNRTNPMRSRLKRSNSVTRPSRPAHA